MPPRCAKATQVNDAKAKAVKGVRQVITIDHGVAVLATGYWAAKKGRDGLETVVQDQRRAGEADLCA